MNPKILAVAVLLATIAFVLSPLFVSDFDGFSTTRFPVPQDNPPVQPAGYAFSIWGVIYLWLIISAVYGLWRAGENAGWTAMRKPLLISLGLGIFWLAAAVASPVLATAMIVVMAATAILAMLRAGEGEPWLRARPVALYAGWLTAATGVGIGVNLGGYGVLSGQMAAILCLVGVLVVALFVQSLRPHEWGYPAAVIWALIGVIVANLPGQNWLVIALAIPGILVLGLRAFRFRAKGAKP
ncbi:MAG: tryptophan-rich sensory protein [Rhodobacteraceae bacterium]|nr:tryptophan-rich sensory protein [Paracoccaceae bacterium]